jgi:uncharacterized protein YfdQ (DUF2303 family)
MSDEETQPDTRPVAPVPNISDAEAIVRVMRDLHVPQGISISADGSFTDDLKGGLMCLPQGVKVVDLKSYLDRRLPAPRRPSGVSRHEDADSFVRHVKRTCADEARTTAATIFASRTGAEDEDGPRLQAVYDYATWRDHRAVYDPELSDEWKAWIAVAVEPLSQARFAAFLEDRIIDILDPAGVPADSSARKVVDAAGLKLGTPSAILTLSRGLAVNVEAKVKQAVNLATGETRVEFDEVHASTTNAARGGAVEVPGAFVIGVPVFRGGDAYRLAVRLRYRVVNGSIVWIAVPLGADKVFDHAFGELITRVATDTGVQAFRGVPEDVYPGSP